jgi:hypothetical protein
MVKEMTNPVAVLTAMVSVSLIVTKATVRNPIALTDVSWCAPIDGRTSRLAVSVASVPSIPSGVMSEADAPEGVA